MSGACSTHGEMIFLESLKGRNHSEDLGVDERIILTLILGKYGCRMWFMWLEKGSNDGFL
jgi:hypothetical protein